jgi:predicted dehydrogenase
VADRQPLRVVIIGCGQRGEEYARDFAGRDGIRLAGIVEPDQDRAREASARWSVPAWAALEQVPDAGVDGVVLCTPPLLRVPYVAWALERGIPLVCEKPLALSQAEGEKLAAMCDAAGRDIMVGYTTRYKWPFSVMHDVLAAGEVGDLVSVSLTKAERFPMERWDRIVAAGHWRSRPGTGGGRHIERSHQFDWLTWIGGQARSVTGALASVAPGIEVDDTYSAYVSFQRGGVGLINVALTPVTPEFTTALVVGTAGALAYDGRELAQSGAGGVRELPRPGGGNAYFDEVERFIRDGGTPVSNQRSALVTLQAVLELQRSTEESSD